MRIMTAEEVAQYPAENPKYDRCKSFFPPDPDLIGRFFPVWSSLSYYRAQSKDNLSDVAEAMRMVMSDCFDGMVVREFSRNVKDGCRPYATISILPVSKLAMPKDLEGQSFQHGTLWFRITPWEIQRNMQYQLLLALRLMDDKRQDLHRREFSRLQEIEASLERCCFGEHADKRAGLVREYDALRSSVYSICASWLFGEGSRIEIIDEQTWYLVTPFEFPPGYVWDTARALVQTFGSDSQFVRRFQELTSQSRQGERRLKPDHWWTSCEDPWAVFMVLFSRMLGPEKWQYTLACLESTFEQSVNWDGTL